MDDRVPTMRTRLLGRTLGGHLKRAGLSLSQAGHRLGLSPSTMSRLVSGKRTVNIADVAGVLTLCAVAGQDRRYVLELAEDPYTRTRCLKGPPKTAALIEHAEATADHVTAHQPLLVPDLLHTVSYTRAVLETIPTITADDLDRRCVHVARRQAVLDRDDGARFLFLLDERSVRHSGADRAVLTEQVDHLIRLSVQNSVDIHVIPTGTGLRSARVPPFFLFEFPDQVPAVCLPHGDTLTVLEEDDALTGYGRLLTDLREAAMTRQESRNWLRRVATELAGSPPGDAGHSEEVHRVAHERRQQGSGATPPPVGR